MDDVTCFNGSVTCIACWNKPRSPFSLISVNTGVWSIYLRSDDRMCSAAAPLVRLISGYLSVTAPGTLETEKLEFGFNTTPSYLDFSLHHLHGSCIIILTSTTRTSTLGWKMNDRTSEKDKEIRILASLQCVIDMIFNPIPFPLSKWFICGSRVESLCSLPLHFPRPCSTMQQKAKIYRLIWSASKIFRCLELDCHSDWSLAQWCSQTVAELQPQMSLSEFRICIVLTKLLRRQSAFFLH